jgi:hypothetical protein
MKRLFVLLFTFLFLFSSAVFAAEGTKVISDPTDTVTLIISEKAPDFLNWEGMIIGQEGYPNGNVLALVQSKNIDDSVICTILVLKSKDKIHIVALAVFYARGNPDRPDVYEDMGFLNDGKPTDKLTATTLEKAMPIDAFRAKASQISV